MAGSDTPALGLGNTKVKCAVVTEDIFNFTFK